MSSTEQWLREAADRLRYHGGDPETEIDATGRIPLTPPTAAAAGSLSPDDRDASAWSIFEPARRPVSDFPPRPKSTSRAPAPVPPPRSSTAGPPRDSRPYRRSEVRRPVHVGVELIRGGRGEPEFAVGADLTPDGLFLLSDSRLPLGDLVRVAFRLPWSSREFSFLARVVRTQPARADEIGARFGFGLEFLGGSEDDRSSLREALRGIPPALPYAPLAS